MAVGDVTREHGADFVDTRGYDPVHHNLLGVDVLHQGERWKDAEGNVHRLDEMMASHRRNLLAFLRRRALHLAIADAEVAMFGPLAPRGEMATDECEKAIDWQTDNAQEWLEGTKLVTRLRELVAIDEARAAEMAAHPVEAF